MEILRKDDDIFMGFAQVYVTLNYPGVIRAWHRHLRQTDHFAVIEGMVKVVLFDDRPNSPTVGELAEFFIGEQNPVLLRIPAGVLHGYKTIGTKPSLLLNFPTELYNREEPDEIRLPYDSELVPSHWDIKMR